MENNQYSRRKVLGGLATVASTLALDSSTASIRNLLTDHSGEGRVREILFRHFQLDSRHNETIRGFYLSLKKGDDHTETAAFFDEQLATKLSHERLERYVIEEFVVSTNYLSLENESLAQLSLSANAKGNEIA